MYLLYVDESGDIGMCNSPADWYILSGLILHELEWHSTLEKIITFRRVLRDNYGLKLREEIHALHFIHNPRELARIPKHIRLRILRDVIDFEATLNSISILNVAVYKIGKPSNYEVFKIAWTALLQRFHNTVEKGNFPGQKNRHDYGIVIADQTDEPKLRRLARRIRKYNPVPSKYSGGGYRDIHLTTLIEDPVHRNSLHSYFVQLADVNAYFLLQKLKPCGYIRRKGGRSYFDRLLPVLCTVASTKDPQGIVRI